MKNYYKNDENLYKNEREDKFQPKYGYEDKNFYSNLGNITSHKVQADDRAGRSTRDLVYGNTESVKPSPIKINQNEEKDLIYSNIQWSVKPENMYSNIPGAYNQGAFLSMIQES